MKSKTMPKGEARPLGTPKSSKKEKNRNQNDVNKVVDTTSTVDVPSTQLTAIPPSVQSVIQEHTMDITLTLDTKPRKYGIVYHGAGIKGGVRLTKSAFANGTPDQTITITGNFAEAKAKVVETKEERKARLAALPKPTLAEKIAKREAALAALKAKAAAAQPAL